MHILAFLIRRLVQAVIVMLIISIIGFSIQDQLGDPLRELVGICDCNLFGLYQIPLNE